MKEDELEAVMKFITDIKTHPDAFYEAHTWWIPLDSIVNNFKTLIMGQIPTARTY